MFGLSLRAHSKVHKVQGRSILVLVPWYFHGISEHFAHLWRKTGLLWNKFPTVLDLIECLNQIKWLISLNTWAPFSELPSYISTYWCSQAHHECKKIVFKSACLIFLRHLITATPYQIASRILYKWILRNSCARKEQYLFFICLRHLIRSRAVTNRIFLSEKTYCVKWVRGATCSELPSNIINMTL